MMAEATYACPKCGHELLLGEGDHGCVMCAILHDVDYTSTPEAVLAELFEQAVMQAIHTATQRLQREQVQAARLILPEAIQKFLRSLQMAQEDRLYGMDIKWVVGEGPGYVLTDPLVGQYTEIFLARRICDWRGVG